jgi:hypothetical protein
MTDDRCPDCGVLLVLVGSRHSCAGTRADLSAAPAAQRSRTFTEAHKQALRLVSYGDKSASGARLRGVRR